MKKIVLAIIIASITLSSCQKEIDWGWGNNSEKLVKVVQKSGADSTVITYSYNSNQKLTREITLGVSAGTSFDNDFRIARNGSGIIDSTIQKSSAFVVAGIDSIVTHYHYSANRYTSAVFKLSLFGFDVTDSAVYSYDGSGKIISEEHFQQLSPLPYLKSLKVDYTYSANGNISSVKQSSYDITTSAYVPAVTLNYTYDTKVNPLIMSTEGIVLNRNSLFGANNATKSDYIDIVDPTQNFTDDLVYIYNTNNKPATAIDTQTPAGTVSNITYYYQ
jgi:hypothetical protein